MATAESITKQHTSKYKKEVNKLELYLKTGLEDTDVVVIETAAIGNLGE